MLRKMISLHLFAAVVCIAANGFVSADCGTCGGGCPTGGCATGNCAGNLLGKLHHAPSGGGGPCMTCDNIWDDYCASKPNCLPQAKYPFQHKSCGGCGACSSCNAGVGVGIYGKCATGSCGGGCGAAPCAAAPCGPAPCDAPCATGKCSAGGLLNKLFKHKHQVGCADAGCSDPGCSDCGGGSMMAAPAYSHPNQVYSQPTPNYSQPAATEHKPAVQWAPSEPADATPSPSDIPAPVPNAEAAPQPPVPPAPSVTDQTRNSNSSGAFNWLQQALQTQ